jgi:hypothetical protein
MKKPKAFYATLGGERWLITFVRRSQMPDERWGDCDWHAKLIRVRYDLSEKNYIDTLIHELRHALSPCDYCAEEWITQTSTEIASAVIAAGVGRK